MWGDVNRIGSGMSRATIQSEDDTYRTRGRGADLDGVARDLPALDGMVQLMAAWTGRAATAARRGRTGPALAMLATLDTWLVDALVLYRRIR